REAIGFTVVKKEAQRKRSALDARHCRSVNQLTKWPLTTLLFTTGGGEKASCLSAGTRTCLEVRGFLFDGIF
ncbi:MAG: hypothetical protein PHG71_08810, partial [Kiritimatiellae bacterium]|nr:hypothetical protein [Kiritimatiellia bacterium]